MLLLDVAALVGRGSMGGGGMWYRTLEKEVKSRWDLLIYLAWHHLRFPPADGAAKEEEDPDIRRQQAEAMAMLAR